VSANRALRQEFTTQSRFRVHIPPLWLCTDNAAMIAGAGYYRYIHEQRDGLEMDVLPNWALG
ncbi:MAG TPA: tRNA (adenosine(37)-N6)-threonylcarbamoyltransferase complex transferase subunit TsaD, partial [Anaerolineales bacterium]